MSLLLARPIGLAALGGLMAFLVLAAGSASAADVKEGQPAPYVDLPATGIDKVLPDAKGAKTLKLKDLQGKKHVILWFYPKALTGGWTAEACAFRDRVEQFAQLDTVIVGISLDPIPLQQKFTDTNNLPFPLLADTDGKVAKAFGVHKGKIAGRSTFVIDKKGTLVKIYDPVGDAKGHPDAVLQWAKDNLKK